MAKITLSKDAKATIGMLVGLVAFCGGSMIITSRAEKKSKIEEEKRRKIEEAKEAERNAEEERKKQEFQEYVASQEMITDAANVDAVTLNNPVFDVEQKIAAKEVLQYYADKVNRAGSIESYDRAREIYIGMWNSFVSVPTSPGEQRDSAIAALVYYKQELDRIRLEQEKRREHDELIQLEKYRSEQELKRLKEEHNFKLQATRLNNDKSYQDNKAIVQGVQTIASVVSKVV